MVRAHRRMTFMTICSRARTRAVCISNAGGILMAAASGFMRRVIR
ncbi:UNVERIFIED_CONTAM: hypothetical protein GTU68_044063 [Idotea baltica]|nr:hypothetical protein [Idotea baltica]